MKKLALFDIDGVFYDGHILFDSVQDQENKKLIAPGTWDAILLLLEKYKKGQLNYKSAADKMLDVYAKALKNQKYSDLVIYTKGLIQENKNKFFPYFAKIIPHLLKTHDIYLVTTNFDFASQAVMEYFGLTDYISSIIGQKNGIVTGKVIRSLGGNKGIASDLIKKYGKRGSVAVGDSENDVNMLDKVDLSLAIEPNSKLENIATKKGWRIVNRKTIAGIIETYAG